MFKIGQKVICIKKGDWKSCKTGQISFGPKYGEELIISKIKDDGYLVFNEYGGGHNPIQFKETEPYYTKSAIDELINIRHIRETSDTPMKNPSPMKPLKQLINNN